MIKGILTTILFFISAFSGIGQTTCIIQGDIEGLYKGKIILSRFELDKEIVDTSNVIEGHFIFSVKIKEPEEASICLIGDTKRFFIYLDSGTFYLKTRIDSIQWPDRKVAILNILKMEGSHTQDLWEKITTAYHEYETSKLPDQVKRIQFYHFVDSFTKQNPDNILSTIILRGAYLFTFDQVTNILRNMTERRRQITLDDGAAKILTTLKRTENINLNFPPQKDTSGNLVDLKKMKYKVLLVDFWASWCVPCRSKHPELIKEYNKYKSKGFEVISVSLDTQKEAWLNAIKQDQLSWTQTSELNGFRSSISTYYALNSIPFNLLVDQNGKIIDRNIFGNVLSERLLKLFSKP